MNKKGFALVLIFSTSIILVCTWYHLVYWVDDVAKFVGYLGSMLVLPVAFSIFVAWALATVVPLELSKKQKLLMPAVPSVLIIVFEIYMYILLQYGSGL